MKNKISKQINTTLNVMSVILVLYILLTFVFKDKITNVLYPLNIAVFTLLCFASVFLLGYMPNKKNRIKDHISNVYIVITIFYLVTIYLLGNATSYVRIPFNIYNTVYLIIYLIFSEIFRYIILTKCTKKTNHQYIITFIYVLFDVLILSKMSPNHMLSVIELVYITLISVLKNSLLSYTSYKYGYYPCFIYAFVVTIMPLIMPLYPYLGNYISLIIFIIYTSIIFYNISKPTRKEEEESVNVYKKSIGYYVERVSLVFIMLIIALVSSAFKYSLSAIASDSMYPEIKRGDAILMSKPSQKELDSLKKGDIIAYEENGIIITHRILAIEEEDEETYFITKGDNNSTKDVTKKKKDDIIGIVKCKIPYIGYPSVEISDIKNKNK